MGSGFDQIRYYLPLASYPLPTQKNWCCNLSTAVCWAHWYTRSFWQRDFGRGQAWQQELREHPEMLMEWQAWGGGSTIVAWVANRSASSSITPTAKKKHPKRVSQLWCWHSDRWGFKTGHAPNLKLSWTSWTNLRETQIHAKATSFLFVRRFSESAYVLSQYGCVMICTHWFEPQNWRDSGPDIVAANGSAVAAGLRRPESFGQRAASERHGSVVDDECMIHRHPP